uniref:Uncharacterized protein n=1 Tax=Setaria viridis TaxID=4556 RepID=A0A4U6TF40_SETVI|nr:hypothetical protein SEVIR_8G138600v2 [Setaria viridis]
MEQVGEKFDDALARVRRCVGGGTEANNADSDRDIEVVADSVSVNLRCPWQCPICLKNYSLENTITDPYFNRITSLEVDAWTGTGTAAPAGEAATRGGRAAGGELSLAARPGMADGVAWLDPLFVDLAGRSGAPKPSVITSAVSKPLRD